ncbi:hypothetical protein KPL71_001190 [Citrus sinensis]|uniref:Uncharacterized protein n=1 Tax=Citrus sinensis TaxID=2711 RepID=A0ACB8NVL4_CITSI|nr:hypothetical protein KPL71_001190 [Citrus sinensis]
MLSAKKSTIATDDIEFLGMIIKDGHYQPGKHNAQELLHFPDQQLSKKQVQQFLGIINYIRDFIPHVDHYTRHLSALLKKKPPEWNADHTNAVTTLKQIAQNPPPLKLITDGKRILQTDASDDSWGAILLEDINRKEHFITYASGQFSDTQKHYHSVFKEILADLDPNLPKLTRPLNPPKLTKPLKHPLGQDTKEIVLIPLAVVPTALVWSALSDNKSRTLNGIRAIPILETFMFSKSTFSLPKCIRTLISTRRPHPKEYIQSSRLDQCALQATSVEQYVTLEIPSELLSNWKREGYTHLHLGGIRLILTLHGRKGLPVTARLAMLDTRFKQYQDAVIGTVLTTLHAESVLLTFYPNFNLSLQDPNLPTTLKVQVQIQGAEQISSAKISTLHHQLVYRLQNHALDLPTPEQHSDTLMVLAESDQIPTIIQIPRQIPRHELIKLMPLEWISNYEQFHNNTASIQTSESMFERRQDGTVRMTFKPPPSAPQEPPRLTFTYSSMITAVRQPKKICPSQGSILKATLFIQPSKMAISYEMPLAQACVTQLVPVGMIGTKTTIMPPQGKRNRKRKNLLSHVTTVTPNDHKILHLHQLHYPFTEKNSNGLQSIANLRVHHQSHFQHHHSLQTQNARAQNDTLLNINSKVEHISLRTEQLETKVDSISAQMQQIHHNLQSRITQLNSELRAMLAQRYYGPEFDQKEREIRRLQAELAQIESEKQRPTLFTTSPPIPSIGPTYHPFASMLSPIRQYDPSKLFGMTHTLFRDNPLPPPPKPKPKPKPQPRPVTFHPPSITIPGQHSPSHTPASPPVPPPPIESQPPSQSKDKQPMHQFSAHVVDHSPTTDDQTSDLNLAVSDSHTETDTESSVSTSDSKKSYADITRILMAQLDQPTPSQTSHTEPQGATTQSVLREFATRFTGALRDWFDSLGRYRQLQFVDLPEVSSALAVLHDQFLGDPSAVFEAARRDYLNMKCCSFNAKDLDFHYKRMSLLFYKLNGFNEPTLKHVFLASLPVELQPDIQRQLTASNLSLDNISLGKIFQLAKTCLDKLCEQKQFFKELLKYKEPFRSACKKPYLQIKCKKKKDCDCSPKKKRHFKNFRNPEFSSRPRRSRKPYRFFRKKSSSSRDFKRRKSSRCFICKKKGHYAKDCPNKREKSIRLVEHLQATTDYSPEKDELEFYFSEQDEPNDETVFALQNSSDDSDSDQSQVIFHQQLLSLDTTVPIPSIKHQILPSKFQRPIPAIGLIDTGAQRSMLNPHLLPPEYWTDYEEHFKVVNGKLFTTSLITKNPIAQGLIEPTNSQWACQAFYVEKHSEIVRGSHDEHRQLLTQFYDIVQSHGIMLSAKKSTIVTDNIEFLGMIIKDGHYLGIIDYIRDFIPHVDHYTRHLSALLKKKPPEWNADHTNAVTTLKKIAQNPPPLKLITDGKRILQTDASDDSWGAILLEEINGKDYFIAYASGQFSDTEKHYHSVFKEIFLLTVGNILVGLGVSQKDSFLGGMGLWTETQKFGGNILVGLGGFRQIVEFQNVCERFEPGLDSNSSGEVVNNLPLTALKCSLYSVQYFGGRICGFNMLHWAPVSMRPIAGTSLWNFEGKIWSLMDGIGIEVLRDNICWWKMTWD